MKQVVDNFSTGSAEYAAFRPESPIEIYDFLCGYVKSFDTAWDCGTGNGQVAVKLAERFKTVYGTDISKEQLQNAHEQDNVIYRQERAEHTSLQDHSIDLITVAQAIHWFDFDNFYKEARRVARQGALLAAWTYSNIQCNPEVDQVIGHLYWDITRPYWDKERDYVDNAYRTIPFPFDEIPAPEFVIKKQLTLEQLVGYLRTWSGLKHYVKKEGKDPILMVLADLEKVWGTSDVIEVHWPVYMRAGYIN